ncbi:type II restriction enzyme [Candidatus Nitrosotenuis sp. DW1]|uniref:type II restriction enzyme n=1 Tax=Candidatus Nitrosotenuis sp. DW1 TaxID=2259672 RepID=UPI0015C7D5A8|nr:AAA-associated domain-containing protein [Candidatus Nitrosotenuis sp. DW1]QLH08922.1 hypothetical protein DSQ19_04985 [Candidatus Nitrosotenuis sp. DW1]
MVKRTTKTIGKHLEKRKLEKWSDIVTKLDLNLNEKTNIVTAKQIKSITGEEPRLMAKIDQREDLPSIFKKHNVFILPLDRQSYAILQGKGYHTLEPMDFDGEKYLTDNPFPVSSAGIESESTYLDYAYATGLLSRFTHVDNLFLATRGRRTTPQFDFSVGGTNLSVKGAQIEIDAGYENVEQIVLVEGKIGVPNTFIIRQLYYPYRAVHSDKKSTRTIFFCYDPKEYAYLFYEYDFQSPFQYDSMKFVRSGKYNINFKPSSLRDYRVNPDKEKIRIPQADDINKIVELPFRVAEGIDTMEKMAAHFRFDKRQSSYYREASEILGLVELNRHTYSLTDKGKQYIQMPTHMRMKYFTKLLLEFPVINQVYLNLTVERDKPVTKNEIVDILKNNSELTGSTLLRRTQTILAWLKWIQRNVGLVEVSKDRVSSSRQMKLEF